MSSKFKDFYDKHIVEDLEVKDGEEKKRGFRVWKLSSIISAFFLIWGLSGMIVYFLFCNWSDRGTFGDMFGAVNALFSALAFAGLVYTLFVQRYELSLQRKELELQRKEVKRNGDQLEEQKNVMLQQSFENTFFKMIELHHNLINSLTVSLGSYSYNGREGLFYLREWMNSILHGSQFETELETNISEFMNNGNGRNIKQYLNNFYSLLMIIHQHCTKTKEVIKDSDYTMIALSQLSDDERYIIFYALGYREETRSLLESFISLDELNPSAKHHANWMRRMKT